MKELLNQERVFVLGNPKSGTTVIANLLSIASSKSLTSDFIRTIKKTTLQLELNFKLMKFESFINDYADEFSQEIVKESFLTFYIDELVRFFPNAKLVYIVRDPFQNIRSILNRLKIPGNLDDLDLFDWDELNKTPVWKIALQSEVLGLHSENYIASMAKRWNYAVDSYLKNKENIVLVKYESFMQGKEEFIETLVDNLGFQMERDISSFLDVQFQPKGESDVNLASFFGDKNFKAIQDICSKNLKKLGYPNS